MTETVTIQPDNTEAAEAEANQNAEQAAEELSQFKETETETEQNQETETERPEWLPEKFESAEDLAKAYAELEQKQSQNTDETDNTEVSPDEVPGIEAFSQEYAENGSLSDESYKALADMGISRDIVDQYIAGIEASRSAVTEAVFRDLDGGEQTFAKISEWAAANLTDAQLNAYNSQVDSGDLAVAQMAVQGLYAQYKQANGVLPAGFQTDASGQGGGTAPFMSHAEVTTAMSDPRYETDPAYRDQVARRLALSNVF